MPSAVRSVGVNPISPGFIKAHSPLPPVNAYVTRVRLATLIPSSSTRRSARQCPCGDRRRRRLIFYTEIPDGGHACARQQADHRHCPHGSLSFQSEPDLLGVLHLPAGYRELGQQRVADRHPHSGNCPHGLRRDPKRGAVLRKEVRCRLLGLQTFRAPLVVERPPKKLLPVREQRQYGNVVQFLSVVQLRRGVRA